MKVLKVNCKTGATLLVFRAKPWQKDVLVRALSTIWSIWCCSYIFPHWGRASSSTCGWTFGRRSEPVVSSLWWQAARGLGGWAAFGDRRASWLHMAFTHESVYICILPPSLPPLKILIPGWFPISQDKAGISPFQGLPGIKEQTQLQQNVCFVFERAASGWNSHSLIEVGAKTIEHNVRLSFCFCYHESADIDVLIKTSQNKCGDSKKRILRHQISMIKHKILMQLDVM